MESHLMNSKPHFLVTAVTALFILTAVGVPAATLPPGFSETAVASGLNALTAMEFAPESHGHQAVGLRRHAAAHEHDSV